MYTLDCIRNKPSALSHSDVHLLTHDVQLPAMMCNYTFYTYKINALYFMLSPSLCQYRPQKKYIKILASLSPFHLYARKVTSRKCYVSITTESKDPELERCYTLLQ